MVNDIGILQSVTPYQTVAWAIQWDFYNSTNFGMTKSGQVSTVVSLSTNLANIVKLMNSLCHAIQAALPNPNVFNPNKNSLGTNRVGLTKFDCVLNDNLH